MTTALIGIPGATTAKANVAVVAQGIGRELVLLLEKSEHAYEQFADWRQFADALAGGRRWDLVVYDFAHSEAMPEGITCPTLPVSEQHASAISIATLDQALDFLAAMAAELRVQTTRREQLEQLIEGLRTGEILAGRCAVTRRVKSGISRAADSDATVLIEGPTGSGKSLAARMIYCKSRRSNQPLHVVDCTTAEAAEVSKLLAGNTGSTIVLENVDSLPAQAQAVVVKHLKERSGPRAEHAARLIATTSAHLPEAIARGAFREDLFYRLNAFPLVMPALKERVEDIREIADSILQLVSAQSGRTMHGITPSAQVLLETMQWPGNVTQLEAVVKRAQVLAGGHPIDREHIVPASPVVAPGPGPAARDVGGNRDLEREISEDEVRSFEEEEQFLLSRALRATKGNVRRAAQLLGIGRATLYRKIQQYKLRLQ